MAMPTRLSSGKVRRVYKFIKTNFRQYDARTLRRLLEVARSGHYAWLCEPISARAQEDARLLRLIRASFIASHGIHGAPRALLDLREAGKARSKHRVARLMRVNKIRAVRGYRSRHHLASKPSELAPNVLRRNFNVARPNKAWVTDVTYIRTWEVRLYLTVVMDLLSRMIVGSATGPTIRRELVLDAVLVAVRRGRPKRTIIHSDHGSHYRGDDWRRFCRNNHLEPSMSRRGNCWDHAVADSFFGSLKKERIKKKIYKNREVARADIADYVDSFYNRTRRHSHLPAATVIYLGGVSPGDFEDAGRRRRHVHRILGSP